MRWQVKSQNNSYLIKLPSKLVDDKEFSVEINGKLFQAMYHPLSQQLLIDTGKGYQSFKPNICKVQKFKEEPDYEFEFNYYSPNALTNRYSKVSVSPHYPGSENRALAAADKAKVVRSPLTGKVLAVLAENGQQVTDNQAVVVIEAMKMENKVCAPKTGEISDLKIKVGDSVSSGQTLFGIK